MHRTPRPLAVVMLSGRVAEDQAATRGATATDVLMAHGDRDAVMPVSGIEPGARVLEAWGARVTTRIHPGLGHRIDARALRDAGELSSRATLATR